MIYPTGRLVLAAGLGAPVALLVGVVAPTLWLLPLGWVLLLVVLAVADIVTTTAPGALALTAPTSIGVGERFDLGLALSPPVARHTEAAIAADPRLDLADGGTVRLAREATIAATGLRRGIALVRELQLRWQGPLGLVWRQRATRVDRSVLVTPDVRSARSDAVTLLTREARTGMTTQFETGHGGEFDAFAQYQPGMDRRRIDWKASARHSALLAKEYRAERDNNIVVAFDCGRTMVEPVAEVARLDRAITAGLLVAYLSFKLGDRVTLFAFDSRPRVASAALTGTAGFAAIRRLAGSLDYSAEETNFTLGLSALAARLDRRSLIILFTDFTDAISAELMLRSVGRLLDRHVLMCVVLTDEALEALAAAEPLAADDVTRAVVAADLLRERRIVLTRLRRMGVEVLEASWRDLGPALAARYLDARWRGLR